MTGREKGIFLSITCLGMSSLITQIITLREFMNILAGNELILGLVLANWLLLTGFGAYLGRFSGRLRRPVFCLIAAQITIALLPLGHISIIRLLNTFFLPGLMLGLDQAFILSFVLLLPYCLVSGFMLTLFSGLGGTERDAHQIGKIYVLDVTGDIIGGFLFSFLLVYFLSPYQSITLLMVINLLAAALLSWMYYGKKMVTVIGLLLVSCLVIVSLVDLETMTVRIMFTGQELISQESTPYGNLVVTRSKNLVTVYSNGIVVGSTENLAAAEESIHYGLSQHPDPENILLVSGGLNGNLKEAVKYPVDHIDYVELDPAIIKLVKRYSLPEGDARINMVAEDARRFLRSKTNLYDAICINLPDPSTAQLNRFYTVEFFQEARKALRKDGVLSFRLSGADNYARPEISYLAGTIYQSLISVFPNILIIPGANHYYIASTRELSYAVTALLAEKNILTSYVTEEYLKARLTKDRIETVRDMIQTSAPMNLDFHPAGYYILMKHWLSQFQGSLLLPLIVMGTVGLAILHLVLSTPAKTSLIAVCSSGFTGLGLEVVLIIAFQICYGYVYQQLGIIITGFLLGTALGSAWSVRHAGKPRVFLLRLDLLLALTAFSLALFLPVIRYAPLFHLPVFSPPLFFSALTALIGFLVGAQFPIAARLSFQGVEKTAGNLYTLDYLGAALGGLLIAAFAIPILGITTTCYLLGCIKLTTSSLLWLKGMDILPETPESTASYGIKAFPAIATTILFAALGVIIYSDASSMTLYAFTFQPFYHWVLLVLAASGILQAMGFDLFGMSRQRENRVASAIFQQTRIKLFRWVNFLFFSLVVFFPLFRCYFKIPYLFCHVCPRQCIFGYVRPYLVPAALIMNLEKRHWCLNCCPLGTMFDCQAQAFGFNWRLPKILSKTLGIFVLAFTAYSYFKVKTDFQHGGATIADWYTVLFNNQFIPVFIVLFITAIILVLSFPVRRPFCDSICPIGTLSDLLFQSEKRLSAPAAVQSSSKGIL